MILGSYRLVPSRKLRNIKHAGQSTTVKRAARAHGSRLRANSAAHRALTVRVRAHDNIHTYMNFYSSRKLPAKQLSDTHGQQVVLGW